MFKNAKSAIIAAGLVLATANAATAANEYHLMCEGPNHTGYGRMSASAIGARKPPVLIATEK